MIHDEHDLMDIAQEIPDNDRPRALFFLLLNWLVN